MLSADDALRGLSSAWALFLGRREAIRGFDTSFRGFWQSFLAIVFVLPIYVLFVGAERRMILSDQPADLPFGDVAFALWRLIALVIDWIAFPLLMAVLARPLGIAGRYVRLIVAFNWGGPIVAALMAVPAVLLSYAGIGEAGASMLLLVALAALIRFRLITARAALDCGFGMAAALVAIELLLSLVLGQLISRIAAY
ncbi:hypothetical protein EDC22_108109 [Tepidamorphus gemmatus]|uniref:Yip1-like protein n=1 Tax=Tepidamorphus gemmatus TaxID=747076 RepID=A0A4R3M6Z8_9HYPH|nr:hypothetical protein [Tepidamorphus gemmatus]TCT08796.1 hypothetical protein EDC22_108109 [Tepidamorphus gemmatus]